MALQPTLRPFIIAGNPDAPHTLDIFLDYVCPFSAKIALIIDSVLRPAFAPGGKYAGKVKVIFRQQVQPWHGSSTFVHEAGLAVARVAPDRFWDFSLALFEGQGEFFDIPTSNLTPTQIREKLADLAGTVIGPDKVAAVKDLLTNKTSPNGGVDVTNDLKYTSAYFLSLLLTNIETDAGNVAHIVKFSRQNSIHVSPTVLWDGLVASEISSSWGEKEWEEFLVNKILV
ncbi:hypothetical protein EIP91_012313 [Steccherinum ochraceum]|uniref:Thioredoxin-like fold domain-containing protein n=1 Tax=Steccherinum ochraceum TaxID=92696 RepID=A0A4R0RUR4_9APHY|nr:hypothetical protein EIP91_012313 [Steccherinum ochraceum]